MVSLASISLCVNVDATEELAGIASCQVEGRVSQVLVFTGQSVSGNQATRLQKNKTTSRRKLALSRRWAKRTPVVDVVPFVTRNERPQGKGRRFVKKKLPGRRQNDNRY